MLSKRSYHRLKGSSRRVLLIAEIEAEECHADNAQRHAHHLLMHIQRLVLVGSLLPAFEHGGSGAGHLHRQESYALSVKGWLHQTPLVSPECSVREQQAIAQKGMQRFVGKDLAVIVPMALLENLPDAIGVGNDIGRLGKQTHAGHIPILAGQSEIEVERVVLQLARMPKQHVPTWPRWRVSG